MSSSQVYPTLPGTIDPQQMCGDVTSGLVNTEWYAPTSVCQPPSGHAARADPSHYPMSTSSHTDGYQFPYSDAYITPYPSSTIESQPWSSYARASVPDISMSAYALQQQQHQHQHQQFPPQFKDSSRPRSSPSTFGPSAENLVWPATMGLGIQYTSTAGNPTPVTSAFPPNVFQTYPLDEQYGTSSPPEIRQPQPRRPYATLAPNPSGVAVKREREDDDRAQSSSTSKRRKRTSSVASADLSKDDRFLVQLKEDESLPWKEIATRFHTDMGKNFNVAALQMRYKRLREKFRIWEDQDMNALRLAHEYWEKYKWEIISAKMLDFGLLERWPARHCARKWQEVESTAALQGPATAFTSGISQVSSPVEGAMHFAFMPLP